MVNDVEWDSDDIMQLMSESLQKLIERGDATRFDDETDSVFIDIQRVDDGDMRVYRTADDRFSDIIKCTEFGVILSLKYIHRGRLSRRIVTITRTLVLPWFTIGGFELTHVQKGDNDE